MPDGEFGGEIARLTFFEAELVKGPGDSGPFEISLLAHLEDRDSINRSAAGAIIQRRGARLNF